MTSITHPASSTSTVLPGRRAHAAPSAVGRLRFGADSKAVRVGLGVAIAAVMAGDVYAVLRSPVAEATSSGRSGAAASGAASEGGVAGGGFVATNPFGEAAYGADLASRIVVPRLSAAGSGPSPAPVASSAPATVPGGLGAPTLGAPTLTSPVGPGTSFVPPVPPPVGGPSSTSGQDAPPAPAAESPLAPVVELVPQAAPVAAIVEDVVASVPVPSVESAPAAITEVVPVPSAVTSGLSL